MIIIIVITPAGGRGGGGTLLKASAKFKIKQNKIASIF